MPISTTACAATSTGSQVNFSSRRGRHPKILTVLSIKGHASDIFQIPVSVSPVNWPIRRILTLPDMLGCFEAEAQMDSAIHLLREYPRESASDGFVEMFSLMIGAWLGLRTL